MITISLITLILAAVITRVVQTYKFLKTVSKLCRIYDRNYLNKWGDTNIQIVLDYIKEDYHLTAEWSAYQWVFFNGPNPWLMPFLMKPLTIEGQYGKSTVDRFTEYYVFEDYEFEKEIAKEKK